MTAAPVPPPRALRRGVGLDGRWLIVTVLVCYFGLLIAGWAIDGRAPWPRFRVPSLSPSFIDLRSVTTGWDCTRRGIPVLPANPCDPGHRPANYPQIWMKLSFLGLGNSSTVPLGIATAVLFFMAVLLLVGRVPWRHAAVWLAVLLSPSVMLGVERGNADLVVFVVVVLAYATFQSRRPVVRVLSHGLLLLAAILKLFPFFAFGTVLRQERRVAVIAVVSLVGLFAVDVALTWHTIREIYRVVPKLSIASYGYAILPDAFRGWLGTHVSPLAFLGRASSDAIDLPLVAAALGIGLAVARSSWPRRSEAALGGASLTAFWLGASIYVGTFLIGHNFDYRLAFLVLCVPQLLAWASQERPLMPLPRAALAVMIGTLWLSQALMPKFSGIQAGWLDARKVFPPDEALNWLLFVYLVAALALTVPGPRLDRGRIGRPRRRAAGRA